MRDDPASATIDDRVHRGGAARQVGAPVLQVDGLIKAFGEKCAVQDVSFKLSDQELVAVLGPSGAGKTTLFRCVTGIIRPDSGRVCFGTFSNALSRRTRLKSWKTIAIRRRPVAVMAAMSVPSARRQAPPRRPLAGHPSAVRAFRQAQGVRMSRKGRVTRSGPPARGFAIGWTTATSRGGARSGSRGSADCRR
jgi:ABC-type glutathione transport system ATPase component